MSDIHLTRDLRERLDAVAKVEGFASAQALAARLIDRGLAARSCPDPTASVEARIEALFRDEGYASREEVIEHLLERGLRAYEEPAQDRETLLARLRGLGYID